ncbi:MAG: molybdopterin biosynthesis protein [Clostridia bacterium]|nr:molybdopterin biosynthesis protein [Clostridia bacterium]
MQHAYLTNMAPEKAAAGYLAFLEARGLRFGTEIVAVRDALDRVSARAVYARISAPHYNACAMDGIALQAARSFGAGETTPVALSGEDFVRVDTGDPLPKGADAVVMIEDCVERDGTLWLYAPAVPWQHVRQIGEDVAAGDMILPSFERISPACMGALLAGGVPELEVVAKPRVAIIPTGDELVQPSAQPKEGEVMEFNSAIFSGMLRSWGAEPVTMAIVPDDPARIDAALRAALESCDAALLLAGTSAGRDDGASEAIGRLGEVYCHGVAMRPGKPAVLGAVGAKPAVGVPGYPVSGIVVLDTLFRPVVERLTMRGSERPETVCVTAARRLHSSLKYREFVRATLGLNSRGELSAVPLAHGAGVVSSFMKADCLIDVPQAAEGCEAGERMTARLLRPMARIERSLRVVGSHDPLIDELHDLMRIEGRGYISSAHVGSMGAIRAVPAGEAQLGGLHLLDPDDGGYNVSWIERYVPQGGVALVECVSRTQGLMVAPGNPLGIAGFEDIRGRRYVNRQKGAGTRVLLDYLLKKYAIMAEELPGYAREELTHTAAAAQIAAGEADCGLGILAAARIYGLDFIPVCDEQYDFLVSLEALPTPPVRAFMQTLAGAEFAGRLERLGGYKIDRPGRIRKLWK